MTLMPYYSNGRLRLARVDATGREAEQFAEENARREEVLKRLQYYGGEQYDTANLLAYHACEPDNGRLPEHERLHAYSSQIAESVDFLSDQLSEGFKIEADESKVQDVVDAFVKASDALSGGDEESEISCDDILTAALVAGDMPVELKWDPVAGVVYPEFWACEQVMFDVPSGQNVQKVVREEVIWVTDNQFGGEESRQVTEKVHYELHPNEVGFLECRKDTYWDQEEEPRASEWLGLPVIPWTLLRAGKRSVRAFRGESAIKDNAMDSADRYDAVEGTSWLIARYNSHGNLVIVGDAAALKLQDEGHVKKDVADVLTFPGGTNAFPLTLPTDPKMIEHQEKVLSDAIYKSFGLTRVDPSTLQGLGGVTGYALEIMNRKTEGTFRRIRRQWVKDWKALVSLVLDITAYKAGSKFVMVMDDGTTVPFDIESDVEEDVVVLTDFWSVDPAAEFPNRKIDIRMGSGYIVDDVQVRDDVTAGLYSRSEGLRKRGYDDPEIDQINREIAEEKPAETGRFEFAGTQAGSDQGSTDRD